MLFAMKKYSRLEAAKLNGFYSRPALKRLEAEGLLVPEASPRYTPDELENLRTLSAIRQAGVSFQAFMRLCRWVTESRDHRQTGIPIAAIRYAGMSPLARATAHLAGKSPEARREWWRTVYAAAARGPTKSETER